MHSDTCIKRALHALQFDQVSSYPTSAAKQGRFPFCPFFYGFLGFPTAKALGTTDFPGALGLANSQAPWRPAFAVNSSLKAGGGFLDDGPCDRCEVGRE